MMTSIDRSRRRFLQLLAASPLVSLLDLPSLLAAQAGAGSSQAASDLIASVADALNVFDFEAVARTKLPAWHWAWMSNGGEDGWFVSDGPAKAGHYSYSTSPAGGLPSIGSRLRATRYGGQAVGVERVLDLAIEIEVVLRRLRRHHHISFSPRR